MNISLNGNSFNGYPVNVDSQRCTIPLTKFIDCTNQLHNLNGSQQLTPYEFMYNWIWAHCFEAEESSRGWIGVDFKVDTAFSTPMTMIKAQGSFETLRRALKMGGLVGMLADQQPAAGRRGPDHADRRAHAGGPRGRRHGGRRALHSSVDRRLCDARVLPLRAAHGEPAPHPLCCL